MSEIVFFKQKTAYEKRISDWSSDVCSSDLAGAQADLAGRKLCPESCARPRHAHRAGPRLRRLSPRAFSAPASFVARDYLVAKTSVVRGGGDAGVARRDPAGPARTRSEERRVGAECVRTC